jgi:CRP-like cAMP-binding protein
MITIMHASVFDLFVNARHLDLAAGARIFLAGQIVEAVFMVVSGRVQLERHTPHGARLILQNAGPGAVLAEASAYSMHYHCDARVIEGASLAAMPKPAFLAALRNNPHLAVTWSAMLARSVQSARVRAEIRSLPKVAERLDAWLGEGHRMPERGHWQEVAAELGVTREALYRELSRRRTGHCIQ